MLLSAEIVLCRRLVESARARERAGPSSDSHVQVAELSKGGVTADEPFALLLATLDAPPFLRAFIR